MSYINTSIPVISEQKEAGTYKAINITRLGECVGIFNVGMKQVNQASPESVQYNLPSGATVVNSDTLNNDLYTSVEIQNIITGSNNDTVSYYVFSAPVRYVITYHKSNDGQSDGVGGTHTVFTDNGDCLDSSSQRYCNCSSTPQFGDACYIPNNDYVCYRRNDQIISNNTVSYQTIVHNYGAQAGSNPNHLNWTPDTGLIFQGWATSPTTVDVTPAIITPSDILSSANLFTKIVQGHCTTYTWNLYPVFSTTPKDTINIFFDSAEINSSSISIVSQA